MNATELANVLAEHDRWLRGVGRKRADFTGADLTDAICRGADLRGAVFTGADLTGAIFKDADFTGAGLRGAVFTGANLTGAIFTDADFTEADFTEADLTGADLTGAVMPDGRRWEEYQLDHLAGICDQPEVREKVIAAWGMHSWTDCPMHAAFGIYGVDDVEDATLHMKVAAWVALYDSLLLAKPAAATSQETNE